MLKNTLFSAIIFQLAVVNCDTTNEQIRALEKEKNELLKQINEAIEDSVKSLQKSNETDALIGLKYMSDLKEHFKHVNDSAVDDDGHNDMHDSYLVKRRSNRIKNKKTSSDPFDFESILKPGKMSKAKYKELVNSRIKMQKQINEWILERERKKERLMKYKLRKKAMLSGKVEKCPRFGYGGKRRREKIDTKTVLCKDKLTGAGGDEEYKRCMEAAKMRENTTYGDVSEKDIIKYVNSERPKKEKYPCCRKCCKKSYLGCL